MSGWAVECECGKLLPVKERTGAALRCSCGRPVIVPAAEEFYERPVLISAATVERRVRRLIVAGRLPADRECACCGSLHAGVLDTALVCELECGASLGRAGWLLVPELLCAAWQEGRVQTLGRDNIVPVPVRACSECVTSLREPWRPHWVYLVGLAVVIRLALFVTTPTLAAFFGGWALLALFFASVAWWDAYRARKWQREWKRLLGRVNVYDQLLREYPHATVMLPSWLWAVEPE